MELHVGTKVINAKPMTRLEYNVFRGWTMPENENGDDEGFLVEYLDGGQANTEEYDGYVSWSPKEVFVNAYKASGSMGFGAAIELLKNGCKMARKGWNGKGMYLLYLDDGYSNSQFQVHERQGMTVGTLNPWIGMNTANNQFVPWTASQTDMLSEDWEIVA